RPSGACRVASASAASHAHRTGRTRPPPLQGADLSMRNRVFFPQAALDEWVATDRVDLSADELLIRAEGRKFRIVEAVRVLREVTDTPDPHDLIGTVKSKAYLAELGAEI